MATKRYHRVVYVGKFHYILITSLSTKTHLARRHKKNVKWKSRRLPAIKWKPLQKVGKSNFSINLRRVSAIEKG